MTYFIITYGCQMNYSDSEKIAACLQKQGYKQAKADSSAKALAKADLIVVNSCSVRQNAINRAFGQINNFPDKKIIVAGCMLESDRKKLEEKYQNLSFWNPNEYFDLAPTRQTKFTAQVPIMTGCNNYCSYCVVPYTRGREKSRPAQEIIAEIKSLIKNRYKEIVLLGQNVNSYRSQMNTNIGTNRTNFIREIDGQISENSRIIDFAMLLKIINSLTGDFWLSFLTSHPKDMSDELIETIAQCEKITPYIHLPIQSGDDEILKKMNRRYTIAHYKKLIKKLRTAFKKFRKSFPPLAVSTDIIAGFPGETKRQFQNTLKLIKDVKFDMIYFAQYSPRPGTAAAKLVDDVSPKEKKRRAEAINTLLGKIAGKINKKYFNKTLPILIYEIKKDFAIGKTATNKNVKIPKTGLGCGDLIPIKITKTSAWGLKGKS